MENDTNDVEAKKPTPAKKKSEKQTKQDKEFVKNTVEINPELNEQVEKTVVLGWGRMNPITVGHEKLVTKLKSVAKQSNATPVLYLTHSQDPKKNPLSYNDKVMLAKRAFGSIVQKTNAKTIMQALAELDKTYDKVILVVGSDRVKEFDTLLKKYNGKDYEFSNISVVSAGDRDPDSDDVSGMSASKMRALAASGKPDEFKKGLPRKLQGMSDKVYDMVRAGMKLAEELEAEGLLLDEALNMQQRLKRARVMKRYASKIKAARQRKMRRKASTEQLQKRARKKAINIIRKKVAGAQGKEYGEMSVGEKIMIDKKVEKRKAAIERIAKKLLPKVRKAEIVRLRGGSGKINEEFEKLFEKPEVKQDPDVKDMPGTQPKSYYKGVKKSVKDDRARHFKRYAKKSDDDPASYKPAPGDKGAKTKESEHTKKYRQMYGEQIDLGDEPKPKKKFHQMMKANGSPKLDKRFKINRKQYQEAVDASNPRVKALKDRQTGEKNRLRSSHEIEMDRLKVNLLRSKTSNSNKKINEDVNILKLVDEIHESIQLEEAKQLEGIKKKSEKSGISYGILKKVFDRGVAAWRTGHRPGTTPSQWGYARVNSFITGGKTRTTADKDLWARHRGKNEEFEAVFDTPLTEAKADKPPRWKRAGPNGELEIKFPTGRRFKIEKQLDHNERHRGEWKVMEWEDGEWEWADTYSPKAYAKEMAMKLGQYKNGKKVADYSATFQYESYDWVCGKCNCEPCVCEGDSAEIKEEHGAGEWGTNKLANRYRKDTPGQKLKKDVNEDFANLFKGSDE